VTVLAAAGQGLDPNSVTPGVVGFLATFALVVVSILLFLNMSSRLRRLQRREEREAERRPGDAGDPGGDETPPEEDRPGDDGRTS
jgi:hypothetical protein